MKKLYINLSHLPRGDHPVTFGYVLAGSEKEAFEQLDLYRSQETGRMCIGLLTLTFSDQILPSRISPDFWNPENWQVSSYRGMKELAEKYQKEIAEKHR